MIAVDTLTAVILAGGLGRRMGGSDKGLVRYHGQPLIEHTIRRLTSQCGQLMINANRNQEVYARYGYPVFSDRWDDYRGPLAGIASAFDHSTASHLLFAPCDMPALPRDMALRLAMALSQQATIAAVRTRHGPHPLCCLIPRSCQQSLLDYLGSGRRRVQDWLAAQACLWVDFADDAAFRNINRIAAPGPAT